MSVGSDVGGFEGEGVGDTVGAGVATPSTGAASMTIGAFTSTAIDASSARETRADCVRFSRLNLFLSWRCVRPGKAVSIIVKSVPNRLRAS